MANSFENPPAVYDKTGRSVPAKWLTDQNGNFVIDPVTSNPYLVPSDFDLQNFISYFRGASIYANNLPNNIERSGFVTGVLLGFAPGSQFDLQRSYGGKIPGFMEGGDRFVSAFTNVASFAYGVACSAIGITETDCLQAGGLTKIGTTLSTLVNGNFSQVVGGASDWFNPPENATNIRTGYSYVNRAQPTQATTFSPVAAPSDNQTRNSTNYIVDAYANDKLVVIKSGGTVWDAYVLQKAAANGFSNWNEFKVAVAASNPGISDLNKIAADTTLMLPEKMPNGSITYNFVGGARINSNAANNEYYMIVPNPTGGWNVYSRVIDGDAGYIIKQISIDKYGRELRNFTGRQDTLQSEVKTISLVENTDFVDSLYASISESAGELGLRGTVITQFDPLVLDLDGDGIETTSPRDGTVIVFDHDADGVKTGTGWVKPDDGWLVLDRNGNGIIDSGRELFGVDTRKSNGQLATDGFDALKDLDANQDGKIDSADSVFSNLRIWRDLNQDGISQANELTSLSNNNIVSIGVNSTAVRVDLGNGNIQSAAGTFIRSNGTTGVTGETNGAAANLDLLVDTFYRQCLSAYFDKLEIAMVGGQVVLDFQPLENSFTQAIAVNDVHWGLVA